MVDFEKSRRESMRWYALLTLYHAAPSGASEELTLSTLQGVYSDITKLELRKQLDYLGSRKLIDLEKQPHEQWIAKLNRLGTDLVEYTVECDPGIARPPKDR